jgi:hypothetical protein
MISSKRENAFCVYFLIVSSFLFTLASRWTTPAFLEPSCKDAAENKPLVSPYAVGVAAYIAACAALAEFRPETPTASCIQTYARSESEHERGERLANRCLSIRDFVLANPCVSWSTHTSKSQKGVVALEQC